MEKYNGVKFQVVYIHGVAPSPKKLLDLDKLISKYISTSKNEGNLSIRFEEGFLISPAGAQLTKLKDGIFVDNVEEENVYVFSGTPSSETIMHWEIYRNKKDVNIILHFHDEKLLEKKIGKEIGPFEYGTLDQAKEVGEAIKEGDTIKIKDHGFVIVAKNKEELKEKLEKLYK